MFGFSNLTYRQQKKIIIFLFLIVPLVLLFTFSFLPMINMFYYSFLEWNGFSKYKIFVGLENYIKIFTYPEYFSVFKVSSYYFVASFVQLGLALYFATILNFKIMGKNFFKGVLFFPSLMNGVAIGFIFLYFFRPDGTLDSLLAFLGLEQFTQLWLQNIRLINVSLAATSVWTYMGFNFIVFLGSIQSIPGEIYEAAEIDGANRWHQFRYIIWPSIKRIIELNLILAIKGAINVFDIPYIMTGGANGSKTFVIQTVDTAFKHQKFGLASAMAVVLLAFVIIVTIAQRKLFKEREA
ncbi:MAG: sugar ABC transporter permease [Halanaerobiales bacterium]|nr:sugar ABC transporter permease [Halanaerobiales bacterium]